MTVMKTNGQISIILAQGIHGPQKVIPNIFGHPWSFLLLPASGKKLNFTQAEKKRIDSHEILWAQPCSSEDEPLSIWTLELLPLARLRPKCQLFLLKTSSNIKQ